MKKWYVVACKPGQESRATENLYEQGYEAYLPYIVEAYQRGDRTLTRVVPMFPDYIFVNFDVNVQSASKVNHSFGVLKLLTFGLNMVPVEDSVINMFKKGTVNKDSSSNEPTKEIEMDNSVSDEVKAIFQERRGVVRTNMLVRLLSTKYKTKAA